MKYEGSKTDKARDRIGMKGKGMTSIEWARSTADRREDSMNDYGSYVSAHAARRRGEPQRTRLYVAANGPFFKDRKMNRDGHDPFKEPPK